MIGRILVVDDHLVVRKGLVSILAELADGVTVDEAAGGDQALELVRQGEYDLVLLDITMPGKSGIEVLRELKAEFPTLPVLMLSMHPEEQYAVQSLRAGASGYLMKASAGEELASAVQKVAAGGKYISGELAERIACGLIGTPNEPHQTLSEREYQVMLMIAAGNTTRDIAEETALSIKTINTFRSRLFRKMGFKNNVELAHYAIEHHLCAKSPT